METTFYDDNQLSVKKMKTNMTLDLSSMNKMKLERLNDVLQTPDVGLLMMNTPELERLIACNNFNTVLTTPTPTGQILFPKIVTEEQEAYARGFIDALGELHKKSQTDQQQPQPHFQPQQKTKPPQSLKSEGPKLNVNSSPVVTSSLDTVPNTFIPTTMNTMINYNSFNNFNSLSNSSIMTTNNTQSLPMNPLQPVMNNGEKIFYNTLANYPQQIENYQMVPHIPAGNTTNNIKKTSTPSPKQLSPKKSISPIDMDLQELAKLERKRERNRHAATLCRNRKLERIARLEERVKELKDQNLTLAQSASLLREQVSKLKQAIVEHTQRGCQVMLTSKFLDSNAMFS